MLHVPASCRCPASQHKDPVGRAGEALPAVRKSVERPGRAGRKRGRSHGGPASSAEKGGAARLSCHDDGEGKSGLTCSSEESALSCPASSEEKGGEHRMPWACRLGGEEPERRNLSCPAG